MQIFYRIITKRIIMFVMLGIFLLLTLLVVAG